MSTRQAALRLKQEHGLLLGKGSQSGGGGGGPTGNGVEGAYQPLAARAEIVRDEGVDVRSPYFDRRVVCSVC